MAEESSTESVGPAPGVRFTVAVVARRLGIAPATLRTWDRRYGLGPSEHQVGAHRRYTAADVGRLLAMRRLTLDGVAPAEAAATVLAAPSAATPAVGLPGTPHGAAAGGGQVIAVSHGTPAARGLARAAMALDSAETLRLIRAHLGREGTVATWDELLRPVLVAVGERWSSTGEAIEVEHLLSECVLAALREVVSVARPEPAGTVLLAAVQDEEHSLPLHVLAAACAEAGVPARLLGARLPWSSLSAAVRRTGPSVVVLHAVLPVTDVAMLRELLRVRPRPLVLLGGPGWPADVESTGAQLSDSLAGTVARVVEAASG